MSLEKKTLKKYFDHTAIEPFYTGGAVSLSKDGRLLSTTLDDEVIVTDFKTGERICRIRGVCGFFYFLIFFLTKKDTFY